MLQYNELSESAWEELAPTKKAKSSPWDGLLDQIEDGKIISIPLADDGEKRSSRIGIARRARTRGYKVEFRDMVDGRLAMKKGALLEETQSQSQADSTTKVSATGKKRGRKSNAEKEAEARAAIAALEEREQDAANGK
mgnify:CR=1 FL=1